jgi:hypothetical protein
VTTKGCGCLCQYEVLLGMVSVDNIEAWHNSHSISQIAPGLKSLMLGSLTGNRTGA